MIRFVDKDGTYDLPTGWYEVTTNQYCKVAALEFPNVERAAGIFAGRSIQVNGLVADALAFLLQEPPAEGGLPYPTTLGNETYYQVELLRTMVAKQSLADCFTQVYGHFMARSGVFKRDVFRPSDATAIAEKCGNWPITDTYPAVRHCLVELQRLTKKYGKLQEPCTCEYCAQARQANIQRFEGFSFMHVLEAVATHFHKDMDTVAQWPAETVYVHLLHERVTHEYQVDLHRVQKGNNA